MTQTPAELIKEKGAKAIADATGFNAGTVRMWRLRNRIPRTVWPDLCAAFPELSLLVLQRIESAGAQPGEQVRTA